MEQRILLSLGTRRIVNRSVDSRAGLPLTATLVSEDLARLVKDYQRNAVEKMEATLLHDRLAAKAMLHVDAD